MSRQRAPSDNRSGGAPDGAKGRAAGKRTMTQELPGTGARGEGGPLPDPLPPWDGPPLSGGDDPFGVHLESPIQFEGATRTADASTVAAEAGRGVRDQTSTLPHADRISNAFGDNGVASIQAHVGGEAAASASAMGAQAYATGEHVVLPETPSLHLVAHEVAHVFQQRDGVHLSGGVGAAGDPHERQADSIADAVVRGDSVRHLFGAQDSRASNAVQHKKPESGGDAPKADDSLPPDMNFERISGSTSFRVRRSWLASDPQIKAATGGFVTPTRSRALLQELRSSGLLSWVPPARIELAAERMVLIEGTKGEELVRVSLGASVYSILGLPPGTGAMVSRVNGGLELTVAAPGVDDASGSRFNLEPDQLDELFDTIEQATQLSIPKDRRQGLMVHARAGSGTYRVFFSRENMVELVGAEAWARHDAHKTGDDGARAPGAGVAVNSDLTELELNRGKAWLRKHLPASKQAGVRLDAEVLEIILEIDRSPHRERIIAAIASGEGGEAITAISLRAAVNEATYEAERDAIGVTAPRPKTGLDPVHDTPLPARIIQHAGRIAAGDKVPFSVEVDWPPVLIDRREGDEYRYRHFVTNVDWVFEKDSTHEKAFGRQQYHGGHSRFDHAFQLAPGEEQATWTVHAFVRHSHFQPTHQKRTVVVQTEAALLRDLRDEAVQGMGSLHQDPGKKNFDTGVLNNNAGSNAQDKGLSFHGRLPPGFTQTTDAQREQRREEEMNQVRAMIAYLRAQPVLNIDAIEAAERYLENLGRVDEAIEKDLSAGWQSFEVRGSLRSKTPGVEDGALTLHGMLRKRDDGFVEVQLRDHSRRFLAEDMRTEGYGSDFAEALEEAFVPLCKAYPAGRLFLLAQDHQGLRPMQTTLGFELDTGTVGEDIKAKVWDPAVKIAVNVAGLVATLAGFGAIAVPALAVYNGLDTIDQLHEEYQRGTLSTRDLQLGLASLTLDMLPMLGRVKAIAGSTRALFMLSLVDTAGEALYMTAAAWAQIRELEEAQVAVLVSQWERMVEMQQTTDAADPAMKAMRLEFEAQADRVKNASTDVITELVAQRAVFVATKRVGEVVAGARGGYARPRWESLRDDGLFEPRPDGKPYYDPSVGKIVGNPKVLDDDELDLLLVAHANHMRLLGSQAAEQLKVAPTDVDVILGDKLDVQMNAKGGVTVVYTPGTTPEAAHAAWRERHADIVKGRSKAPGLEKAGEHADSSQAPGQTHAQPVLSEGSRDPLHSLAATLGDAEFNALRAGFNNDALLAQLSGAGGDKLRDMLAALGGHLTPAQGTKLGALVAIDAAGAIRLVRVMGADIFGHAIESAGSGLFRINGQLEVHGSRLAEIAEADLRTIVEATGEMATNATAAQIRLAPFAASGSYRLRFRFQLEQNENWLTRVLDRAGLRADPRAQRILAGMDDAGRIRLNEPRGTELPAGIGNIDDATRESLQVRAARYALDQAPADVREFVNHYEMFTSEYLRQRNVLRTQVDTRVAELRAAGETTAAAQTMATTEILGRPINGFRADFNNAVLDRVNPGTVSTRAAELTTQLGGRVGARALGTDVDIGNAAARVQARSDHQFSSTSSATYHANKHWRELPRAHQSAAFAPDHVSQYLRSANETIQHGVAEVARNQDGTINVSVTRDYGGVRLRAICRIDASGDIIIATYGNAP